MTPLRIGEEFNVFTDYSIEDVDVQISLSRSGLQESILKDANPIQLARLLPVLKETVENAVGIESHDNRYFYDNTTESLDNLLGGYIDGEYFVPVRFGLKHIRGGETVLYVVVDQQKIEAEVIKATTHQNDGSATSRSASTYSKPQVVSLVNSKDLLRYLPDDMLTVNQKQIKQEGIAETVKYTNVKNDAKYGGDYADFAKAMINLDRVLDTAVLIEIHGDKYEGTSRANKNLEAVYVLFGTFQDGTNIIPVQMEIKNPPMSEEDCI